MFSLADTSITPASRSARWDRHVVGTIAGKSVDLVDDAVVDLVLGHVLDHPHQFGPVGLARGLARVHELFDHGRAELFGLPAVRFALGRDGVSLVCAALFCLLLGGDAQVGHGHGAAGGH